MFLRLMFLLILAASAGAIYAVKTTATGQAYVATVLALATSDRAALFESRTPEEAITVIRSRYQAIGGEAVTPEPEPQQPTARDFSQRNLKTPKKTSAFGATAATAPRAKEFGQSE